MICTKKHLNAVPIILDDCDVELCAVRIKFQALNVIIVAVYLPPLSTALPSAAMSAKFDSFCSHIEIIQQRYAHDKMVTVGDFNLSRVT